MSDTSHCGEHVSLCFFLYHPEAVETGMICLVSKTYFHYRTSLYGNISTSSFSHRRALKPWYEGLADAKLHTEHFLPSPDFKLGWALKKKEGGENSVSLASALGSATCHVHGLEEVPWPVCASASSRIKWGYRVEERTERANRYEVLTAGPEHISEIQVLLVCCLTTLKNFHVIISGQTTRRLHRGNTSAKSRSMNRSPIVWEDM